MHAGEKFTLKEVIFWTRRETFVFLIIGAIPTIIYDLVGITWITIPWLPIALVGTAVAFLVGFKNNATYDRLWEGRQIWGAIVNTSRTWGIMARDYVTNSHNPDPVPNEELNKIRKRLVYRHIAWLTALRFQLRSSRVWESINKPHNKEYRSLFYVQEQDGEMLPEMEGILEEEELASVMKTQNPAAQILSKQSEDLRDLMQSKLVDDFRHMEMENILKDLFTHQGKCERIKNFPYPRQFATINLYFVWIFILLVPFGMIPEFVKAGENFVWLTIPFSALVAWVFHTMEKIGEATENPFMGGANDVPITSLSRTIEIDLREMLGETELPEPIKPEKNILM